MKEFCVVTRAVCSMCDRVRLVTECPTQEIALETRRLLAPVHSDQSLVVMGNRITVWTTSDDSCVEYIHPMDVVVHTQEFHGVDIETYEYKKDARVVDKEEAERLQHETGSIHVRTLQPTEGLLCPWCDEASTTYTKEAVNADDVSKLISAWTRHQR